MKPVSKLAPDVSQGTGFLVRSDGLLLTAFHVVDFVDRPDGFFRRCLRWRGIHRW